MASIFKISEAASLALHSMGYISSKNGARVTARELAEKFGGSEAHVSKIMQRLERVDFIAGKRGPGGGFIMICDPTKVTLLDVYQAIEGKVERTTCFFGTKICNTCMLGDLIPEVEEKIIERLKSLFLSEVVESFIEKTTK